MYTNLILFSVTYCDHKYTDMLEDQIYILKNSWMFQKLIRKQTHEQCLVLFPQAKTTGISNRRC